MILVTQNKNISPIQEVPRLFLTKHYYLNLKISNLQQSSRYRNVHTDPQGNDHRSVGICGAHFGNDGRKVSTQLPCLNFWKNRC